MDTGTSIFSINMEAGTSRRFQSPHVEEHLLRNPIIPLGAILSLVPLRNDSSSSFSPSKSCSARATK